MPPANKGLTMVDPKSEVVIQQIMLEWRKVASHYSISQDVIENARVEEWFKYLSDTLTYSLVTHVLTHKLQSNNVVKEVEVPATWWQHTKQVHFPTFSRWLRSPVKMKVLRLEVNAENELAFPQANIRLLPEQLGKPVYMQTLHVDGPTEV